MKSCHAGSNPASAKKIQPIKVNSNIGSGQLCLFSQDTNKAVAGCGVIPATSILSILSFASIDRNVRLKQNTVQKAGVHQKGDLPLPFKKGSYENMCKL